MAPRPPSSRIAARGAGGHRAVRSRLWGRWRTCSGPHATPTVRGESPPSLGRVPLPQTGGQDLLGRSGTPLLRRSAVFARGIERRAGPASPDPVVEDLFLRVGALAPEAREDRGLRRLGRALSPRRESARPLLSVCVEVARPLRRAALLHCCGVMSVRTLHSFVRCSARINSDTSLTSTMSPHSGQRIRTCAIGSGCMTRGETAEARERQHLDEL